MSKSRIKLSICIPTYRRDDELRHLLDSLVLSVSKLDDASLIEICVTDNDHSGTDATKQLVYSYDKSFANIRYLKNDYNLGANLNMLRALKLGSGSYRWLLGSDDIVQDNALSVLLTRLSVENPVDLYLLNRYIGDADACPLKADSYLAVNEDYEFDYSRVEDRLNYLSKCCSVDGLGCFFSSLVFSERFLEHYAKESESHKMMSSNIWGYMGMLHLAAASFNPMIWSYVSTPLVIWRAGNSHLKPGAELVKMCHMFRMFNSLKLESRTRHEMKRLAGAHFKKANTLDYFAAFGSVRLAFSKISAAPIKNSILLPFNLLLALRPSMPRLFQAIINRALRVVRKFTS